MAMQIGAPQTTLQKMPMLFQQLEQGRTALGQITDALSRLSHARSRIANPVPREATKSEPEMPQGDTVENQLAALVRCAESLARDLHALATEFEQIA